MVRSYGQYCALAKSLDVVGDRWTMLIVRELLEGPRRYGDLLAALAPVATDVLATRLRELAANGLVSRRELARPASGRVYELTEDGRALEDVVNAHARWGRRLLDSRDAADVVRPQWLARALRAFATPDRPEMDLVLRLVMPEGQSTLRITRGDIRESDAEPDVTLIGDAETLFAAMNPNQMARLVRSGSLVVDGSRAALRRLSSAFGPAPAATGRTARSPR